MVPIYDWHPESAGTLRVLKGYSVAYRVKRGAAKARLEDGIVEDIETFVDMRNEKPSMDSEWSREMYEPDEEITFPADIRASYEAYGDSIIQNGLNKLTNDFTVQRELDTGVLDYSGYGTEYD